MGKEITMYDIARELGISIATVSRALNGSKSITRETAARILGKAKELGYRYNNFAGNLSNQKSHTIGVIVPGLNSNFISSVLAGIEQVTTEAGYDLLITHSDENYETEVANTINLYYKRVDGVIASLALPTKNTNHFSPLLLKNIPVIFFDRVEENSVQTHVVIDNYKSGYEATLHLIDQGCRRVAILTSAISSHVYHQRHRGYNDAIVQRGLKYDPTLLMIKPISETGALEAVQEILAMKPRPDGLFVTNDFQAAMCMQNLKDRGIRIPEDIAIVGFNNDAVCKIMDPQLSTINYPEIAMGEIAARKLLDELNGVKTDPDEKTVIIKSELIIRKSSMKKTAARKACVNNVLKDQAY